MKSRGLTKEREALAEYVAERPSAGDAEQWLAECGMERVVVEEHPLEIESGPGNAFLYHPLLRGGFLDDAYECFTDQNLAEQVMSTVANDLDSFLPLVALRCVMSGWKIESMRSEEHTSELQSH